MRNDGIKPLKLLFTILSILLLAALGVFSVAIWQDVESTQFSKLHKQNQTLIKQSQTFLTQQTRLVAKTVQARFIEKKLQGNQIRNIFDYLLSATGEAAAYALLDTKGKMLLIQGEISSIKQDQQKSIIKQAMASNTAQVGYLHRAGLLGQSYLPFYIPILNGKKKPIAITVVFFRAQGKNSLMSQFVSSDDNTIWLLGNQGKVRMTHPVPTGLVSNLFGWQLPTETIETIQQHLSQGRSNQGLELEIRNKELLANASYLAEYQLIALNSHPKSMLYASWLERIQPVAIIFVLFLAAALFTYRIALRISKKISEDRNKAEGNVHKLSKAIEQSPNSVVITDNHWCIEYANSHFNLSTATPNTENDTSGHNIIDFPPFNVLTDDLEAISKEIEVSGNWFGERKTDFEGKWFSFSISHISNQSDDITHYVTVVQDISSRKQAEATLYKQANFDALTGLPNRRKAHENLTARLQTAWKEQKKVAVLYLDIDNFKNVNDTFGHHIGDQLLQLVSGRLLKCCKDHAQICHIGGDEFLIYTSYSDVSEVEKFAARILYDVQIPVTIESKQIFISTSIGISKYPEDSNDVAGLIKFADMALYESKKSGRNRQSFFNKELDHRLKRRNLIEIELRYALERNEMLMHYQSKNDIKTGHIMGFEALIRWNSAALGPIGPFSFIDIAEETGIINDLGEFALRQACTDLIEFQRHSDTPLKMAVNLSVRQLSDDKIIDILRNVIKETGIDPNYLELEITESLLAENLDLLLPRLEKLLEQGVSLSIDDFGTGYSSLSYLTSFPVSTLKVDRAFVKDMATNEGDATLAHTIITMAHALGLKVVAEGIEDETQLGMLREYGCDIGQGYLFSKPIPKHEMIHLVETEHLPNNMGLH
ncbi:bifunctional diguanylate cyclase/phosphodiesterase [Neptuniibacter sp.]|uniref:putative bifunctional diguanylate cyclase/phosphodiesterase n=1 Tax=Neptuniibacter sp. TaxID=1962643 RepID=UPI002606F7D4|nr:bifunctional diguanylate cyclase/phosphodiesterase [Neptuniibacter sp.]MCP4598113.1 EAL domain-containing protein [Neptuniibacter sp.]